MKKIGIIGAGVAGINSAYHLIKKGYLVDLHESRDNLGGRINSFIDNKMNDEIDNGQHILIGAYKEFIKLLIGLNTFDLLKIQKALFVKYYSKDSKEAQLDTSFLYGDMGMIIGLIKFDFLSTRDKINIVLFVLKLKFRILKSKSKSILEVLKYENQSDNSILCFWEPMILATMNTQVGICDASLFINVLKQGFFAGRENAKIIIPKVGLCNLINPIIDLINENNGNVYMKNTMTEIIQSNDKIIIKNVDGDEFEYDEIIIAIPPDRISKLIGIETPWANEFEFSPIISVYLWFEREFFDDDFASILGTNIQWLFNKRLISGEIKNNSLVSLTISEASKLIEMGNKEIVDMCESELRQIFPKLNDNKLLHYRVIKERNATLLAKVGIEKAREKVKSINNKIHFAGCWTDTKLPSTIEGAALSGKIAVDKIK
jgi:squalene-associated FAD-dependent desaturase